MEQVLTGTVHGNTIVLDGPVAVPDGQSVEVIVRDHRQQPIPRTLSPNLAEGAPPSWWTPEDDRILDEIYQARKSSTRPEITE